MKRLVHPHTHRLCSVLTLLVYAAATIGVPVWCGAGNPNSGCRCADDLKASGECCCRKAHARQGGSDEDGRCATARDHSCCARNVTTLSRAASGTATSCCSSRPRAPSNESGRASAPARICRLSPQKTAGGCCQQRQKTEQGLPVGPVIAACNCGSVPTAGLFVNSDPSLLAHRVEMLQNDDQRWDWRPASPFVPDRSIAPETPPPEVPIA